MLCQIIFLLITARQINISHQCELHNQECDSRLNILPAPGPFPCVGNVPGIPSAVAPGLANIADRSVAAVNHGSSIVNLGSPEVNFGSVPVKLGPVQFPGSLSPGSTSLNIVASSGNMGPFCQGQVPAVLNVGPNIPIDTSWPSFAPTAKAVLGVTGSPLSISNVSPIRLAELIGTGAGLPLSSAGSALLPQRCQTCIRHVLVPVPVQVVEECITNVPVIRKTIRHQAEIVTRNVPIHEKTVTQQLQKIIRHVPVATKSIRNVIESRIRHVPVIKSRSRTVVEPYTVHVPITERSSRPVVDSITTTVPYTETRTRPFVVQRTRFVPVVERRRRPVVETTIQNVPVKRNYVRNIVERRVRPVVGPCAPCPYFDRQERAAVHNLPESIPQDTNVDIGEYQHSTVVSTAPNLQSTEEQSDARNHQYIRDRFNQHSVPNSDIGGIGSPSDCRPIHRSDEAFSAPNDGCSHQASYADQQRGQ